MGQGRSNVEALRKDFKPTDWLDELVKYAEVEEANPGEKLADMRRLQDINFHDLEQKTAQILAATASPTFNTTQEPLPLQAKAVTSKVSQVYAMPP